MVILAMILTDTVVELRAASVEKLPIIYQTGPMIPVV